MSRAPLELTRPQILAYRRRAGALEARLPPSADSLRRAAWAGLQDSMPRAALLSIHARVEGTHPSAWEDPSLVQLWGPRYSVYVVAAHDLAVFSLGRLPDAPKARAVAESKAAVLREIVGDGRMLDRDVGVAAGAHPNSFRYGAATGTILLRWDGARAPLVWTAPRPEADPRDARLELARRYLHLFGPTTPEAFAGWAGIPERSGTGAFEALGGELLAVRTPFGDRWILAADEDAVRAEPIAPAAARLLPSGDAYWLLWGRDRELLVPDPRHRAELWTPRVWPGAVLVGGDIVGTWRRRDDDITVIPWRALSPAERDAVAAEAESLPLPGVAGRIRVGWIG